MWKSAPLRAKASSGRLPARTRQPRRGAAPAASGSRPRATAWSMERAGMASAAAALASPRPRHHPEQHRRAEDGRRRQDQQVHRAVAGVEQRLVAAGAAGEGAGPDDAERDGGQRRCDGGAGQAADDARERDGPEARRQRDGEAAGRDDQHRAGDQRALGADGIDHQPDRRLRQQPGEAADRERQADLPGIPVVLGQQVDAEIGPEPVADIGEQDVEEVECPGGAHPACRNSGCTRSSRAHQPDSSRHGWSMRPCRARAAMPSASRVGRGRPGARMSKAPGS